MIPLTTERIGWFLAGLLAVLMVLWSCAGCAATMTGPSIDTMTRAAEGQTLTATRVTGPNYSGKDAKGVTMPPVRIGADGTVDVGRSGAEWWEPFRADQAWILLAVGSAALIAGVVIAIKFPALAFGWPLAGAGVACIGLYFYRWLILAGVAVWYLGTLLRERQAAKKIEQAKADAAAAEEEAARQQAALSVVTRAVANSPADIKAVVKRKVADTIAAGSDLDAAIQEAKRT